MLSTGLSSVKIFASNGAPSVIKLILVDRVQGGSAVSFGDDVVKELVSDFSEDDTDGHDHGDDQGDLKGGHDEVSNLGLEHVHEGIGNGEAESDDGPGLDEAEQVAEEVAWYSFPVLVGLFNPVDHEPGSQDHEHQSDVEGDSGQHVSVPGD